MNVGIVVILFLLGTVVSSLLSRALPALPRPLVQIGFGAVIGALSPWTVSLDPALFFLLIVPPLLFIDAWRLPNDAAASEAPTILSLALVLVFVTVTLIGLLIHALLPQIPQAVAFALAAVVSPTDPVSVSAIATRVPMPRRLMTVLQGEALLNDSVGLVCFRFAVAAIASGGFSLVHAGAQFLWLSLAGLAAAVVVTWLSVLAIGYLNRHLGAEAGSTALVTILIPFGAYLAAERLSASGILAAAVAGLAMTTRLSSHLGGGADRIVRRAVWDMLSYTLNGVTFVLLGEQLPSLIRAGLAASGASSWPDAGALGLRILAVLGALYAVRLVIVALAFALFPAWRRGIAAKDGPRVLPLLSTMTVASPRGALTLAGILTLPATVGGGAGLPSRDLAILIAVCIIIATTTIASLLLPACLRALNWPSTGRLAESLRQAEADTTRAALQGIEEARERLAPEVDDPEILDEAVTEAKGLYQRRLDMLEAVLHEDIGLLNHRLRMELIEAAIEAERHAVRSLRDDRRISIRQAVELDRLIDLREAGIARRR